MSDITVIGLGLMGAALARTIQRAGHDLTVWNRSPAKMQTFIDDGVAGAPDVVSAITASPVILICIDNYVATNSVLRSDEVTPLLSGRTVVQLSTGTPREANESADWMKAHDVSYLDGAILGGPRSIGTDSSIILLSGEEAAGSRSRSSCPCSRAPSPRSTRRPCATSPVLWASSTPCRPRRPRWSEPGRWRKGRAPARPAAMRRRRPKMPAWKEIYNREERMSVVAYIKSKKFSP